MIESIQKDVYRLHANSPFFHRRDSRTHRGSCDHSPVVAKVDCTRPSPPHRCRSFHRLRFPLLGPEVQGHSGQHSRMPCAFLSLTIFISFSQIKHHPSSSLPNIYSSEREKTVLQDSLHQPCECLACQPWVIISCPR